MRVSASESLRVSSAAALVAALVQTFCVSHGFRNLCVSNCLALAVITAFSTDCFMAAHADNHGKVSTLLSALLVRCWPMQVLLDAKLLDFINPTLGWLGVAVGWPS